MNALSPLVASEQNTETRSRYTPIARRFCQKMMPPSPGETLGGKRFDVILFGDLLEHLKELATVLRKLGGVLAPSGYIVASLPKFPHATVRLAWFKGDFNQTIPKKDSRPSLKILDPQQHHCADRAGGLWRCRTEADASGVFNTEVKFAFENIGPRLCAN